MKTKFSEPEELRSALSEPEELRSVVDTLKPQQKVNMAGHPNHHLYIYSGASIHI